MPCGAGEVGPGSGRGCPAAGTLPALGFLIHDPQFLLKKFLKFHLLSTQDTKLPSN